jgi:formylglycine-generating enzyme required for sulfatase activity
VVHAQLLSKGDISERFRREAEALTLLDHPNIVKVHDVVEESGRTAIVMEWVPGRALSAVIGKETGPIPWDRAQAMVVPLLSAVSHAHSRGIVHRDLKPENIVVMPSGEIKLLDFGIARLGESRGRTKTGTGMGTVDYMAPEQFLDAKGVDSRADIYALGLTLYEMLAGRLPWDAADSEYEVMKRKEQGSIPPPTDFYPSIPPWVVSAVMAAIRPSPLERTQSVALLEASLRGEGVRAQGETAAAPVVEASVVAAKAPVQLAPPIASPAHGTQRAPEKYSVAFDHEVVVKTGGLFGIFQSPERRRESGTIDFSMAVIPPCTFTMGSPANQPDRNANETQHVVRLTRGFAMGTTPVTQALWTAVMGSNPAYFTSGSEAPQRPVEKVSWFDSVRFCNALSGTLGLRAAYTIGAGDEPAVTCDFAAPGFRLPTEAEWECAARAGTAHRYAGGDDLSAVGWFEDNSDAKTHAVAQMKPNAWGLYDMSGNVWEWTSDWYADYAGNIADPTGGPEGPDRVARGGSWSFTADFARPAYRNGCNPGCRFSSLGFRLSRTIP